MKSAVYERQQGHLEDALATVEAGLKKFPMFPKLHMLKGQILTQAKDIPGARAAYASAVKACPKSVPLWLLASRLEEQDGRTIKARSLLDKARLVNPKEETLWAEAAEVEERAGATAQANAVLARGWCWPIPRLQEETYLIASCSQVSKTVRPRDYCTRCRYGTIRDRFASPELSTH